MDFTYTQRKILAFTQKRIFTDSVCWIVYYGLTLGFFTLYLWNQSSKAPLSPNNATLVEWISESTNGDWKDAFQIIIRDGLYYTFYVMLMVYLNLLVYKKILDSKARTIVHYGSYLLVVVLSALFFAFALKQIIAYTDITRIVINFPTNVLTIFCLSIISTGMLYLRQATQRDRILQRHKKRNAILRQRLEKTSDKLQEMQLSVSKDHLKVGSKNNYKIIAFQDIILFKGDGNEPRIYTTSGKEHIGSTSMSEYQSLLPLSKFIRVHRSYIVNKDKVVGRKKNKLIMEGFEDLVSIGETYMEAVNRDERLGWQIAQKEALLDEKELQMH